MIIELNYRSPAGIYAEGQLFMNTFNIDLSLKLNSEVELEQEVAIGRMNYIIDTLFHSSILIENNPGIAKKFQAIGVHTIQFPSFPSDQMIAMLLMTKLNAVMEGRILISNIKISSDLTSNMTYSQTLSDNAELGTDMPKGWATSDPKYVPDKGSDKVVNLESIQNWDSLGLGWNTAVKPVDNSPNLASEINFDKNENK